MGTQATIAAQAYTRALHALDPHIRVDAVASQLLVGFAEEGWVDGEIARAAVSRYIGDFFKDDQRPDTIILGCTHFPLLGDVIAEVAGPDVTLIDCGIAARGLINGNKAGRGEITCLVTDAVERFTPHVSRFLGIGSDQLQIEHIDLTQIINTGLKKVV